MSLLDDATAPFEAGDLGTAPALLDRHHHHVATREPTREGATAGRELAGRIRAAAHGRQARRAADQERWFGELEEHLQPAGSPPPAVLRAVHDGADPYPAWVDGLVGLLWLFLILELLSAVAVALSTDRTEWRVAVIAGGVFWATMLLSVIAILHLLRRIAGYTYRPPADPPPRDHG